MPPTAQRFQISGTLKQVYFEVIQTCFLIESYAPDRIRTCDFQLSSLHGCGIHENPLEVFILEGWHSIQLSYGGYKDNRGFLYQTFP